MSQWEQLFIDGEFMTRARLLSGLTVEQVSIHPTGHPHSIYQELWHTTTWQSIVVQGDARAAAAYLERGPHFPSEPPADERAWKDLVAEFLAGSVRAVELGRALEAATEQVALEVVPADPLENLAVHNAYHLGKIVALRQVIGAWPPPG